MNIRKLKSWWGCAPQRKIVGHWSACIRYSMQVYLMDSARKEFRWCPISRMLLWANGLEKKWCMRRHQFVDLRIYFPFKSLNLAFWDSDFHACEHLSFFWFYVSVSLVLFRCKHRIFFQPNEWRSGHGFSTKNSLGNSMRVKISRCITSGKMRHWLWKQSKCLKVIFRKSQKF